VRDNLPVHQILQNLCGSLEGRKREGREKVEIEGAFNPKTESQS
jgi:hypothetical protein